MRGFLAAVAVIVALGVTAGTAGAVAPPLQPSVVCSGCDGGGPPQGCRTTQYVGGDGWGDWTIASEYFCWYNGSVTYAYGWCGYSLGGLGFNSFNGFNADRDIPGPGHLCEAHFDAVSVSIGFHWHHDGYARACVQVNGWGGDSNC
jgi:hypothetical protein